MIKILILIDDFNETNQIRTLLKKVGCDVDTMNNELGFKDKVVSFKPDIVIISGSGKKINASSISKKLHEITFFNGKVILLLGHGVKISLNDLAENKYDGFLESPFDPTRLMTMIHQMGGEKTEDLLDKYQKFMVQGSIGINMESELKFVKGKTPAKNEINSLLIPEPSDERERVQKYQQMVEGITIGPTTITKAEASRRIKEMQKDWNREFLDEIDEEKREFVKHLFKKAK